MIPPFPAPKTIFMPDTGRQTWYRCIIRQTRDFAIACHFSTEQQPAQEAWRPRLILSVHLRKRTRPAAATSAEHRKGATPIRTLLRHGGQDGAAVEADEPQHSGHSQETFGQDRLRVVRAARKPQRIPLGSPRVGPWVGTRGPVATPASGGAPEGRGVMLRRRGKTRDAGRLRHPCRAGKPRGSRLRSLGAPPCG